MVKSGFFCRKIRCLGKRRLLKVRSYIGSIKAQNFRYSTFNPTIFLISVMQELILSCSNIDVVIKLKHRTRTINRFIISWLKIMEIILYMIHSLHQTDLQSSGQKYYYFLRTFVIFRCSYQCVDLEHYKSQQQDNFESNIDLIFQYHN